MMSDETKYACDMLPYDTALNTIGFEMRNNCVVRGIGYFGHEIMDLRECQSGTGNVSGELGWAILGYM